MLLHPYSAENIALPRRRGTTPIWGLRQCSYAGQIAEHRQQRRQQKREGKTGCFKSQHVTGTSRKISCRTPLLVMCYNRKLRLRRQHKLLTNMAAFVFLFSLPFTYSRMCKDRNMDLWHWNGVRNFKHILSEPYLHKPSTTLTHPNRPINRL